MNLIGYLAIFSLTAGLLTPGAALAKKENILDFEADVIEAERNRPYIFFETGEGGVNLDSILYLRNDFNDFHRVDKSRRPLSNPRKEGRRK